MMPGMRQVTVEKVAILAVMAGCKPEQLPLALALAELLCQKKVAEEISKHQTPILQIAVGGPAKVMIGSSGSPGADSIGRLARLMLIHLGNVPGPVFEKKPIWVTVPNQGETGGESTIALYDVGYAKIWKQSTKTIDKWR